MKPVMHTDVEDRHSLPVKTLRISKCMTIKHDENIVLTSEDFHPVCARGLTGLYQVTKPTYPQDEIPFEIVEAVVQMAKVLLPPGARFVVRSSLGLNWPGQPVPVAWVYDRAYHNLPDWEDVQHPEPDIPSGTILLARRTA